MSSNSNYNVSRSSSVTNSILGNGFNNKKKRDPSFASASIAANATDPIRLRQNFKSTASSARKETPLRRLGLVFAGNHKNASGKYIRYYRSKPYLDAYSKGKLIKNPYTQQPGALKVAYASGIKNTESLYAHLQDLAMEGKANTLDTVLRSMRPELARQLLLRSTSDSERYRQISPLDIAITYGKLKVIDTIFKISRQLNIKNDYIHAVLYATTALVPRTTMPVMRLILSQEDLDINARNVYGNTILTHTIISNQEAAVSLVLSHPSLDVNQKIYRGNTALITAIKKKFVGAIRLLLNHKDININIRDSNGNTARDLAYKSGNIAIIRLIEEYIQRKKRRMQQARLTGAKRKRNNHGKAMTRV